jgi:hypothetical protein
MTLDQAIKSCFKPEIYAALKGHMVPPELLRTAALECFLHEQAEGVEDVIRAALIFHTETGLMPPPVDAEDTGLYVAGIEYSASIAKLHPRNCAVIERTGDGVSVGACMFYLKDGKTCPRHGQVKT